MHAGFHVAAEDDSIAVASFSLLAGVVEAETEREQYFTVDNSVATSQFEHLNENWEEDRSTTFCMKTMTYRRNYRSCGR